MEPTSRTAERLTSTRILVSIIKPLLRQLYSLDTGERLRQCCLIHQWRLDIIIAFTAVSDQQAQEYTQIIRAHGIGLRKCL